MKDYLVRKPFTLRIQEGEYERVYKSGDIVSLSDAQLELYGHMVEIYVEPETISPKPNRKTEVS